MNRNKRTKAILAVAFSLGFSLPVAAQQTVTVMAYTGLFQDRYTQSVIVPFEKANPGIKVVYAPMASSGAMIGQLRAQKAAPQADVVIMDVSVAKAGTDENLFVKLDEKLIPVVADLYPNARFSDVAGVAVTFDNLVMLYNSEAWPKPPTSLSAMTEAAVKGKVVIPGIPDIQAISLLAILDKKNGGNGVEGKFGKGFEAMEAIAPNVQTWEPKPEVYVPIIAGQASIGVGWNARAQVNSDTSGGKLKAVIPVEGTAFQINTINLVQGSTNTDAAKKFIGYALSPEAQKAFTENMFYAPTNAKAQIAASAIDRTAVKSLDKVVPIDWLAVATIRDALAETWRRKIIPLSR